MSPFILEIIQQFNFNKEFIYKHPVMDRQTQ